MTAAREFRPAPAPIEARAMTRTDPGGTPMAIRITGTEMSSDLTRHAARMWPAPADACGVSLWSVSWLPGRLLTQNQAVTAMTIAEAVIEHADDLADNGSRWWVVIDQWAAVLAITGPHAVAEASLSPEDREALDGPQAAHMCECGHHAAEHSNIESGECLADGCGCIRLREAEAGDGPETAEDDGVRAVPADGRGNGLLGLTRMAAGPFDPPAEVLAKMAARGMTELAKPPATDSEQYRLAADDEEDPRCRCGHPQVLHDEDGEHECHAIGCDCTAWRLADPATRLGLIDVMTPDEVKALLAHVAGHAPEIFDHVLSARSESFADELAERIDARDEAEYLAEPDGYCTVCGANVSWFMGYDGPQHFRGPHKLVTGAERRELFTPEDGHASQVAWRQSGGAS